MKELTATEVNDIVEALHFQADSYLSIAGEIRRSKTPDDREYACLQRQAARRRELARKLEKVPVFVADAAPSREGENDGKRE